ncbi:MAG: 2,4'-dihydroxyacetophenone dioxygenase family protein [Devosia sp.]|nr:2,4'-dihydroxyacetophenone dioxygenase family protein [Devosia sp.]
MTDSPADELVPYQLGMPADCAREIVIPRAIAADNDPQWVPQQPNVWFRPLCLSASQGFWVTLLKVRRAGVLTRHRHPKAVHGWVVKGCWHYLEHDWVAEPGSYVYEPPGETHTLVVDNDDEMITLFKVDGAMIYVDPFGKTTGYDDVFTKIDRCREHFIGCGLGADYVNQFIR